MSYSPRSLFWLQYIALFLFFRRLFAWLLGLEVNLSSLSSNHPVMKKLETLESRSLHSESGTLDEKDSYFEAFSKSALIESFTGLLNVPTTSSRALPDFRPYKVLIPLLDKPEIGQYILDHVFLDLLRYLFF